MYGKISALLSGVLLLATTTSRAQVRPQVHRPAHHFDRATVRHARPVRYVPIVSDDAGAGRAVAAPAQHRPQMATPGSWGTMIGQTTYDLQTNRSMPRRVAVSGNTVSTTWTQTCTVGTAPTFPNRGVGYNLSTNAGSSFTNGLTGNCPSNFGITNVRSGWPELVHVNGFEFVAAHTGTGIVTTRRALGTGSWPATTALGFTAGLNGGTATGTWPRLAASGNSIHLIYCANDGSTIPQAPSGVINPLLYARSTDGGLSWGQQNVLLPGMSDTNFKSIGSDLYAIDASGSTVAIATGAFGDHLVIWKSTNNGTSFTPRVVINDYTANDTIDIDGVPGGDTATVVAPDGSMSVVIDNGGKVHWFGGTQLVQVVRKGSIWKATGLYFPDVVRELWYWNDDELLNSIPRQLTTVENFVSTTATFNTLATGQHSTPFIYNGIGAASMPTTTVDANGDVYVIYAGGMLGTSNDGTPDGQYYRDLYLQRLSFPGSGQVQTYVPKNISRDIRGVVPDGAAAISEESVFPTAYRQIVNGKLHYQWMTDFEPGTALQPAAGPDPEVENAIMYDALDMTALNWTPGVVLIDASCSLSPPTIVTNTPACGGTLMLSASGVPLGATYHWAGPNGFTSVAAAPQIPNATPALNGSYQLTIEHNGCLATAVQVVNITLPSAAFSYGAATYCFGSTNPLPTITGTNRGIFTATPAGLTISSANGEIDLGNSAPGTYVVTYTVGSGTACEVSQTQTITLANQMQAGFSYPATTVCAAQATTLSPTMAPGATRGTFSASPAGLVINAATGVVNLAASQVGAYTITNTIAAVGACPAVSSNTSLTLVSRLTATVTAGGPTTFCRGGSVTLTASGGTSYLWSTGATTPAITVGTTGNYSVTVSNGGCSSAAVVTRVTVTAQPATPVIAVSPAAPILGRPMTLAVVSPQNGVVYTWTGPGLAPAGVTGTSVTITPAGSGLVTYNVTATAGSCQASASRTIFVASQPGPVISYFTPISGSPGTQVTVFGSGFSNSSALLLNGTAISGFTVLSDTSLTLTIPANALSGKFTLTTPGGSTTSGAMFRVLPLVISFSPTAGVPGTVVTISGSGLSGTTAVNFGSVQTASFTIINGSTLTAVVPPNAVTGKIVVTTTGGGTISNDDFMVGPIITGLVPAQGPVGSVVLVQGLNLVAGTTIRFNGQNAVVTGAYGTQLTTVVPAGAGSGLVTATNPAGTGTSPAPFTVTPTPAPTITDFSPTANVIVGTTITITGTDFTGATLVRFNNVNASSFTVNSATSITATVPAGATSGRIFVATPNGMGQSARSLRIIRPPLISGFTPGSGRTDSVVTIMGNYFTDATSVAFGAQATTHFTIVNATRIIVAVPAGATTGPVQVTSVAGTATSAGIFTILGPREVARAAAPVEPFGIELFPNPASEWVEVQLNHLQTAARIELFDNLGRVVREQPAREGLNRFTLQGLPSGLYVVRVGGQHQRLRVE